MAHRKIYLAPKRKKWVDQFKPDLIRGKTLRPSLSTGNEFAATMEALVSEMARECEKEIFSLFVSPVFDMSDLTVRILAEERALTPFADTMDASIASQSRILLNKMQQRFQLLFNEAATSATKRMVERSLKNSATNLKTSLKDMAGNITLSTDILSSTLSDVVTASVAQSVALFKSIPTKYFDQVEGSVMRSITTGRGLQDLIPEMEEQVKKHGIKTRNWAKNTALDQTRKVYNSVNSGRMQALGLEEFEWIHSGGSNDPRPLHQHRAPNGLNGGIFRFDDPPVIGEMYGAEVRGLPGDLPNCHCTMRPVFRAYKENEE